jgi:arsenate reductase (thioredoxin)
MTINVPILCTHDSARSVLAEGMLNHWAAKIGLDVKAHGAGSASERSRQPLGGRDA